MDLELNISCPNVENNLIDLYKFLNKERTWCSIKLSPITDIMLVDKYYKQGFRQFHCCNTLSTIRGGLSDVAIQQHSLKLIKTIKNKYPDVIIVGGGGIRNMEDIKIYKNHGADIISTCSIMFNPLLFGIFYYKYKKSI